MRLGIALTIAVELLAVDEAHRVSHHAPSFVPAYLDSASTTVTTVADARQSLASLGRRR